MLYKQFAKKSLSEMEAYLDELYNGEPHRILAEVVNVNKSYVELKARYFLIQGDTAQPFNFFPEKDLSIIKIGGDFKKKFIVGKPIVCTLRTKPPDAKGQVFMVRADEIDDNFETIENFYQRYGITYEPKYIYEMFEGGSLSVVIGGDFKDKLCKQAEEIVAEREKEFAEKYSELEKRTAEVDAELVAKKSQAETEIAEKIDELDKLTAEVDADLAAKKAELQSIQEKISTANSEWQTIKNFYGVYEEETITEKVPEEVHEEEDFDKYISYWQEHLWFVHDLTYRKEILESVYWGLHTDQLILLTGSPGTGKTSLVRALPECFGWYKAAIIPVQANWTDKSDLLGYYNPLEKNYMSTPFLDALLKFCRKAEKNPKDIFIICLDEMNLAHVEHYFEEFLSVLQSDRVIRLYSDELRRDIFRELKYNAVVNSADDTEISFDEQRFMKMNLEERKYYLQLCRMANMFFKYPAQFKIPTNIKFFGTLNQDATTLDISPKVIDRSFVIRVEKYEEVIKINCGYSELYYEFEKSLKFRQMFSNGTTILYEEGILKYLNSKIFLSERIIRKVLRLLDFAKNCHIANHFKDSCDILIASFVLPKIRLNIDTDEEKIAALKNLCEEYPYSKEILEKYMTSPDGKEIDYWRQ